MSSVFPTNIRIDKKSIRYYHTVMNQFLITAIEQSGKTKAEIADLMQVRPQSVHGVIHYPAPKPASVASILLACGWQLEAIKDLKLGDIYDFGDLDLRPGEAAS